MAPTNSGALAAQGPIASTGGISGTANDGSRAPKENPNAPPQQYGPNNEQLPEELQSALRSLIDQFRIEGLVSRRHEILKTRRARYYWQGQQFLWFDWNAFDWALPYQGGWTTEDDKDLQEQPRYNYVINVYQPFGLAFIAVFASRIPTVRFFPQSLNRSEDITAAKASTNAAALIEEQNNLQQKMIGVARLLWTDGKIGAYVRYVCDKERFGETNVPQITEGFSKLGEDQFKCPQCGNTTPVSMFANGSPDSAATMDQTPACFNCGSPLGPDDFLPATRVPVPINGPSQGMAKGQVCIDFRGSLELATPPWCNEFWEFPWLQEQFEVHKGKLKAAYPHVADKISANVPMNAEDVYGRATRLAVAQGLPVLHPGDTMYNLVTYLRTWLRPWAFDSLDDKKISQQLKELFPDGCYCAFAGQTYCESRNEKMADHWRVFHALPGDGQSRPAVGEASLEIQDQVNTLGNMAIEAFEYGIPPVYADPEVLDFEALTQRTIEPGVHVPARPRAQQKLVDAFFQPTPAQVPAQLFEYLQELQGPVFQLVTGVTAAVFGGSMDDMKTAKAYSQARDMSLGRLSTPWNSFKNTYAEIMQLAVKCFRDNEPGDVERVLPGENSEFQSQVIKLADLDGETNARPDPDETYPRLRSQKQNALQQLMALNDPEIAAMMMDPANVGMVKSILGLDEFSIPTENARTKQLREIEKMLALPVPIPVQLLDDHKTEFGECQRWSSSDDGQTAAAENPMGYQAVELHAQMHQQAMQMMAMQAAMPQIAAEAAKGAAQGPPGGDGEAPPDNDQPNL